MITKRLRKLKPLIDFKTNDFIVVQILQRKKDNPDLKINSKKLKSYNFFSWDELENQLSSIQEICDTENARAYIRLNKQNAIEVSLRTISKMTDNIRNGLAFNNYKVWNSMSGQEGAKNWWVLDIDKEHIGLEGFVIEELSIHYKKVLDEKFANDSNMDQIRESGYDIKIQYDKIYPIVLNTTSTGLHIICKPFDKKILEKFNNNLSSKGHSIIQLHEDANTILYLGKNDSNSSQDKEEI